MKLKISREEWLSELVSVFICLGFGFSKICLISNQEHKIDGVGPVDNRPCTNKLHHFVKKKKEKEVTCDT